MKRDDKKANYRRQLESRLRGLFAYFRSARIRLESMPETLAAKGDMEQSQYAYIDSIIVACCYLDALRVFRHGEGRNGFIQFLQECSNPKQGRWYRRISCLYLDQPPLDTEGKVQHPLDATEITNTRHILYGDRSPDVAADLSIDVAVRRFARAGIHGGRDRLNRFSYAAYFYERYRCHGVHNVQPSVPGVSGGAEPYYEPKHQPSRLVFPRPFILETLTACTDNFEAEALRKLHSGPPPSTADDYRWLKETYGLKSTFIETVCAYYVPAWSARVPAAPLGSDEP